MTARTPTAGVLSPAMTEWVKGVAILLIVLHNFFHNIPPLIGENEFSYDPSVVTRFWRTMQIGPTEWIRALFSFLGHYGVTAFVVLSGFGVAKSLAARPRTYGAFMKERFAKVYVTFVVAIGLYLALFVARAAVLGHTEPLPWRSLALKLLLVSNVLPGEAVMPVGPWWFLPFIFQVYAVLPLLVRLGARPAALAAVAVAAWLVETAVNPLLTARGMSLHFTVVGHLPVVCLGVYLASKDRLPWGWPMVGLASLGFALGCVDGRLWSLTGLWAAVLFVSLPALLAERSSAPAWIRRVLGFYGRIAMPLFLVNGFLRKPFSVLAGSPGDWHQAIAAAGLSLLFSTAVALALEWIDDNIRKTASEARLAVLARSTR